MITMWRVLAMLIALATWTGRAWPQAVRITGVTTFQYLDVRPLEDDSIAQEDAIGSGLLRQSPDGYAVRCVGSDPFCRYRRTGSSTATIPAIQDLSINVWGLARGVRLFSRVRARAMVVGDEGLWPRANDVLDVTAAYVEINRTAFRIRAGRLWRTSGLGYYNFDGASIGVQPVRQLTAEAFAGWSLLRGLNETVTSQDLVAVEPLAPDARSYLFGGQLSFRPQPGLGISTSYQREIRDDWAGLYSERIAVDGVARTGSATFEGTLRVDLSTADVNDGRLRLRLPRLGAVSMSAYARHHSPFFDLWTIWGAFTPLGFDEIGMNASWHRRGSPLTIEILGAGRRYRGAEAEALFGEFRTDGWRLGATMSTWLNQRWHIAAQYRADIGFGAAKSEGMVRVQREYSDGNYIALNGSAFQRLYEFRIDDATVFGLGADAAWRRGTAARLVGSVTVYRHTGSAIPTSADWTQIRGSIRVEWTLGAEPSVSRPIGVIR